MEPVSSLFLNQLGVNSVYGPEDARKICKVMIDMYDMNRHLKDAVQNIKTKVGRVGQGSKVATTWNENVNDTAILIEDRSMKAELSKVRGEMRDLASENEELKKIIFGVDSVHLTFKDCCAELFGPECKSVSSFSDLRDLLHSFKAQESALATGIISPRESGFDIGEVVKLQKEVFIAAFRLSFNIDCIDYSL